MRISAVKENNLEPLSASNLLDELELLERYLKAEKIDIHLLERYSNSTEAPTDQDKSEQKLLKDKKDKPRRKKRNRRELSR